MKRLINKQKKHARRKQSIRKKVKGTADRPRVAVFRSLSHIYAQIIDDVAGVTIVSESDVSAKKGSGVEKATQVGESLGKKAVAKKVKKVVFDRSGYKYHGRVKALADGLRTAGLEF